MYFFNLFLSGPIEILRLKFLSESRKIGIEKKKFGKLTNSPNLNKLDK